MSLKSDSEAGIAVAPPAAAAAEAPSSTRIGSPRSVRRWSLALRLTAWYALSAFILILLASVLLYWALSENLNDGHDVFLVDKIQVLEGILRSKGNGPELRDEVAEGAAARQYARVLCRVLDASGKTLIESSGMSQVLPAALFPPPVDVGGDPEVPVGTTISSTGNTPFRAMSAAMGSDGSGAPRMTLQVALSKSADYRLLSGFRRWVWVVLGVALLVCIVVGHEVARQGIRPLNTIAATARRVRSTTLHERIDQNQLPAELSDLAVTFNNMLDRLQEAFSRLSRFSADIAHELRTPVNNLRGQVEVALSRPRNEAAYQEVLGSCLEELVRLSRIIESLLFLARAENPRRQLRTEKVDVLHELEAVREFYDASAAEAGVTLHVSAPPNLPMDADRTLLQRAVGNLVANALAHTPPAGSVRISAAKVDSRFIRIMVEDTGCGIPPEHLPHVQDRFYRVDRSRANAGPGGNVGLGLAIVRSISTMHDGRIDIQSEVGKGTRVMLYFPQEGAKN